MAWQIKEGYDEPAKPLSAVLTTSRSQPVVDMSLMLRDAETIQRKSQSEDVRKLAEIVANLCRQLDATERDARNVRTAANQAPGNGTSKG